MIASQSNLDLETMDELSLLPGQSTPITRNLRTNSSTAYGDDAYDDDTPSLVDSEVSSVSSDLSQIVPSLATPEGWALPSLPRLVRTVPQRKPLQWEFHGLTLWLELEEVNGDLSQANYDLAGKVFGTGAIPLVHITAIYGMTHLTENEAKDRLQQIPQVLKKASQEGGGGSYWPEMDPPVAIKQDIAQEGRPGQVCSVAWAELTFSTNERHERAMDALYSLFYGDQHPPRTQPWTPHMSLAYDNPEDTTMNLSDVIQYVTQHPTLMQAERSVRAISLWSTEGQMKDWELLDRIRL